MLEKKVLIVSARMEFLSFCKIMLKDEVRIFCLDPQDIDCIQPAFFSVCAVLIDEFSFPGGNAAFACRFLENILCRSVFVCSEKQQSACAGYETLCLDKTFRNSLFSKAGGLSAFISADCAASSKGSLIQDAAFAPGEFAQKLKAACGSDSTVLLLGESGSGKSHAAQFIHDHSSRRNGKFTSLNLAEINPNLMESALFGTARGSFTGAEERTGILEGSKDGTLFLDEIAELSLESQGKFLRILDSRTFCKVGSSREIALKSRLVFATDADLPRLVGSRRFKEQLFYRISVLVITVPPLRERKEEIRGLAMQFAVPFQKKLSDSSIRKLLAFPWPGNIRQLKNCIERSCICAQNEILAPEDIIFY